MNRSYILVALISAALFGISTPAAKLLLGASSPIILAGLLYCGAGLGVSVLRRLVWPHLGLTAKEVSLGRQDWPWMVAAIVAGGIVGPCLLMLGLQVTEASTASLLLTLEGVATALIAWFVFRENFDSKIAIGMAFLVAGAAVLAWTGKPALGGLLGPIAIVGACIAWGLDNNFTRKVSLSDPLQIVELKGLIAGPVTLGAGLLSGGSMPPLYPALQAMLIGFLGYGVSLAMFVLALRHLGTARTGAYFSTAPFLGAVTAVAVLGEAVTLQLAAAGALMAIGVWLHLIEHHEHEHTHEPLEHAHPHAHDEHHQHAHELGDPPGEPHTHLHRHERQTHSHPHVPDMHHTHTHRQDGG